jgi:hypothetical protein
MVGASVVSVKVPPDLLERVRRTKDEIDWPEELRAFIRERLRRLGTERLLAEVRARHSRHRARPWGFASGLVREDRDRH